MKKIKYLALLVCALPLSACGTETVPTEEAVDKQLPTLLKTTADTYAEEGCATIVANINSFNLSLESEQVNASVPLSGKVTLAVGNLLESDSTKYKMAAIVENFNLSATIKEKDKEEQKHELKNINLAAYVDGGNAYIDISNTNTMNYIVDYIAEYTKGIPLIGSKTAIKLALGDGKYKIDNALKDVQIPQISKEVSEEDIASALKQAFAVFEDEDLKKIMALTHNTMNGSYNLKFTVTDPEIINRTSEKAETNVDGKCDAVNLTVEAWTNDKGVFTGAAIRGNLTLKGGEETAPSTIALSLDTTFSVDFTKYGVTHPSFDDYSGFEKVKEFIEKIISGSSEEVEPTEGDSSTEGQGE